MIPNFWRRWLRSLRHPGGRGRRTSFKVARRRALALENLEDRTVLSVFNAPLVANLPAAPVAEAVGHFRSGGRLDVVTANADGTVSVLLGNGDGSLKAPVSIRLGATPDAVAVGDLLGNGRQDIVTSNTDGTVSVLLSNGDGTFQSLANVAVGNSLKGVALGDLLGNGRQDIVAVSSGTVSVLLTNADSSLGSPINTQVSGSVGPVAVADFNGDGKPDLAVGTASGLSVLQGNGDGTFQLTSTVNLFDNSLGRPGPVPAEAVAAADLRGDGKIDLVAKAGTTVQVVLGNGDGTFQAPAALGVGPAVLQALAVGDFTGDGKPDIATVNLGQGIPGQPDGPSLTMLVGNGDGTFRIASRTTIGGPNTLLAAGDFRGDGKLDLVAASFYKTATVFLGNGDGTFNIAPSVAAGVLPRSVAAGDFTASGRKQDLVVADYSNLTVLLHSGTGTFRSGVTLPVANGSPVALAVGDFNGEGKDDIAVGTNTGKIFVFLGNGDGTFQKPLTIDTGFTDNYVSSLVVGDFNGDGKLDLAAASTRLFHDTGAVTVYLSNGDGTFQSPESFNVGAAAGALAAVDLRGNGTLDLVTTTPATDGVHTAVKVLSGNGDGTFQNPVTVFTGAGGGLAVGDFLGNGRADILTYTSDGTLNLLVNNGDGTFQSPIATQAGGSVGALVVGNFFGDGKLSLALSPNGSTGLGAVSLLRGNGDGTFQGPITFMAGYGGTYPTNLTVGDFTGNGLHDLAFTSFITNSVTVLLNQGVRTAAPPTLQSVVVNDGSGQDPAAHSLTVTISSAVTLSDGALEVQDASGNAVPLSVSTALVNGRTVATVTFTGGNLINGALPTGGYTLTAHTALIHDASGQALQQVNGADPTFAFTSTVATASAPTVTAVRLNEGAPAPANVGSITLHFSGLVTLGEGAVEVLAQDGSAVGVSVAVGVENGATVAVLTFTGDGLSDGALPDGAYTLVVHGNQITDGQGQALGGNFAGDNAADFTAADAASQPDIVGLFHPLGGGA
jgi:hypothetical protein